MKKLKIIIVVMGVILMAAAGQATTIDLTTSPGSTGDFMTASDGSLWRVVTDLNPTGSGVFDPFLRYEQYKPPTGINEGMNSNVEAYADKPPAGEGDHTHAVLFSNMLTVNIGGTDYWDFTVDFNEPGTDTRFLSFDQYDIYAGATNTATTTTGLTPIFNSLDTILTDYTLASGGSGWADIEFLIPVQTVPAGLDYMYLYMYNGSYNPLEGQPGYGTDWSATDGFEEIRHLAGEVTVPEPLTILLLGVGLVGLASIRRK